MHGTRFGFPHFGPNNLTGFVVAFARLPRSIFYLRLETAGLGMPLAHQRQAPTTPAFFGSPSFSRTLGGCGPHCFSGTG